MIQLCMYPSLIVLFLCLLSNNAMPHYLKMPVARQRNTPILNSTKDCGIFVEFTQHSFVHLKNNCEMPASRCRLRKSLRQITRQNWGRGMMIPLRIGVTANHSRALLMSSRMRFTGGVLTILSAI